MITDSYDALSLISFALAATALGAAIFNVTQQRKLMTTFADLQQEWTSFRDAVHDEVVPKITEAVDTLGKLDEKLTGIGDAPTTEQIAELKADIAATKAALVGAKDALSEAEDKADDHVGGNGEAPTPGEPETPE